MSGEQINEISGPVLLVALLNAGLLGVLSVQVFLYSLAFPNDRVYMKCLVYGVYILESAQSVLIAGTEWRVFVTGFGNVEVIDQIDLTWLTIPILTAIDTFFVQGFYAHRIRILSRSKKVMGMIIVLSLIQLGGGIALGVQGKQKRSYSLLNTPEMKVPKDTTIGIWNVGGVLCDIIIAVCMTYYLSRYDTTIKATRAILKKIIRLTIETGTLTAVVGIVCFSLAMLPSMYYQVPMGVIGKVYANSMLVLINSRMLLGSEEAPSTIISQAQFAMTPANDEDIVKEEHSGDISVYSEDSIGHSRCSRTVAV